MPGNIGNLFVKCMGQDLVTKDHLHQLLGVPEFIFNPLNVFRHEISIMFVFIFTTRVFTMPSKIAIYII